MFSFNSKSSLRMIKVLSLSALFLGGAAFSGCDDEDSPVAPETQTARVMAVHTSPDAPGVDLLVDNSVVGTNLTFPNNTDYLQVDAGTRNIKVNVSGSETTVIEADLPIAADKNFSVFAIDEVASLSAKVVEDDLTTPASGKSHVRFLTSIP